MLQSRKAVGSATGYTWFVCALCGKWKWCRLFYGQIAGETYSYLACDDCTMEII